MQDLETWKKINITKASKILHIFLHISIDPFKGTGKPEPLKFNFADCWSRRIDLQHRIVYEIKNNEITVLACRYHYS